MVSMSFIPAAQIAVAVAIVATLDAISAAVISSSILVAVVLVFIFTFIFVMSVSMPVALAMIVVGEGLWPEAHQHRHAEKIEPLVSRHRFSCVESRNPRVWWWLRKGKSPEYLTVVGRPALVLFIFGPGRPRPGRFSQQSSAAGCGHPPLHVLVRQRPTTGSIIACHGSRTKTARPKASRPTCARRGGTRATRAQA